MGKKYVGGDVVGPGDGPKIGEGEIIKDDSTCRAGVTERIAEPQAEQENIREYRGKRGAFYFRHVEFDVPPGKRKRSTIIQRRRQY